jgi:hypothetical protein
MQEENNEQDPNLNGLKLIENFANSSENKKFSDKKNFI